MKKKYGVFSNDDIEDIKQAIMLAELDTSGEIHVHIDEICEGDCKKKAEEIFHKLNLTETEERNAVLFYLAYKSRKFYILPDIGIQNRVDKDFWIDINHKLLNNIRDNNFTDGLIEAITDTGKQLKKHFPREPYDKNQISDDITFGDV